MDLGDRGPLRAKGRGLAEHVESVLVLVLLVHGLERRARTGSPVHSLRRDPQPSDVESLEAGTNLLGASTFRDQLTSLSLR